MDNFNTLSADGKEIKWATVNGRIVYSSTPDLLEKLYQDEADILSSGHNLSSASYVSPNGTTYNYSQWQTFEENGFTGAGSGNVRPFAVSPHILATATHYGSTIRLGDMSIGGTTVTRQSCVKLEDWALSSGRWDPHYIQDLNIGDITFVLCDLEGGAVPQTCLPYFISPLQFKGLMQQDSIVGTPGWTSPQILFTGTKYAAPIVIVDKIPSYASKNELKWTTAYLAQNYVWPEYKEAYKTVQRSYLAYSGDSGRPVYFTVDTSAGKLPVVVSHYHSVAYGLDGTPPGYGVGPDYIQAFDIIREFVKEYEGYDALQQLPAAVLSGDYS